MTILEKYKLLSSPLDIIAIKTGEILKNKVTKKCYRCKRLYSSAYHLIMIGPIQILWILIFFYMPYFGVMLNMALIALIHLFVEIILIAITPLEEVKCWEKNL